MDSTLAVVATVAVAALLVSAGRRRSSSSSSARGVRVSLVRDRGGNESLVVDAVLAARRRCLFMIDTAYAGAPVLSTSYLSSTTLPVLRSGDVGARFRAALAVGRNVGDAAQAVRTHLLPACRAYTSGCTMRLMGIGTTTEAQSDMLLCPALHLDGAGREDGGDVFMTHPLPGSVHILTCDYLLHRAPCVIRPHAGEMRLRVGGLEALALAPTFHFFPAVFVGGAFAVPMVVGGVTLEVVVDTGAGAALSLGSTAVAKLRDCVRPSPARRATQAGVNGERVCSDVLRARVAVGPHDVGEVEVFANDHHVEGADGYAGMGLLRAFDLWLAPDRVGFRRSGLAPRDSASTAPGECVHGESRRRASRCKPA